MSNQYEQMWKNLGLDLKAHYALLGVLGDVYKNIYVAQTNRPESMGYFDFVMSEVHGLRVKELIDAKAQGRKVIGAFCVYVPEELVIAANGILVGLCAGAEFAFDQAEKHLPRTTCALIKSIFGFNIAKVCPYMEASDMIVGENTCDGKKKAYEIFKGMVKNLYVMDMPQTKSDDGKNLIRAEYAKFKDKLEELTGVKITAENLNKAIKTVNAKRKALIRLNELRKADPSPISGLDALLINQLSFFDDPARFTESVNKVCDELEKRAKNKKGAFADKRPRVIISGCPMAIPNWKLPAVIESSGGAVVAEESCVGERSSRWLTKEDGAGIDAIMENIVERYFNIDCAIFTPNPNRVEHVKEMAKKYKADGVIHYALQFCQPYQIESASVEKELAKAGIPLLRLETDYSQEDMGQLKTRVEAFFEMIK